MASRKVGERTGEKSAFFQFIFHIRCVHVKAGGSDDRAMNIKKIFLLIGLVLFDSACKLQFPFLGAAGDFGPPVQKTSAAQERVHCIGSACLDCNPCLAPAFRSVAYALEAKPAIKTVAAAAPGKTTPAPSPGGPRLSALIARDELEKLSIKTVAFNASQEMTAGVSEKVEVRMAETLPQDFLVKLKELGIVGADDLVARSSIKARLIGDGFEIRPLGDEERKVGNEGLTPWMWDVTPVQSGTQPLVLLMTVNVKVPGGGNESKELPVFSKPAQIAGSRVYSTVRFLRSRWPWFAGGFSTLGVAVWFLRRRRG